MATPNRQKLQKLRTCISTQQHSLILQHYLQARNIPDGGTFALNKLFRDAMLVAIKCNKMTTRPFKPLDIGLATFDRRRVTKEVYNDTFAGPHAEKYLNHIWNMYIRLEGHAHVPEDANKPRAYHFGTTVTASKTEVKDFLTDIWQQLIDEDKPELGFRPIICLYFDNEGKRVAQSMWNEIRFNPSMMDTNIATLDGQVIAEQAKIARDPFPTMSSLLSQFDIEPRDVENCGNAVAYVVVIAMLSALKEDLYKSQDNKEAKPGQFGQSASKTSQVVVDWLIANPTSAPPIGTGK